MVREDHGLVFPYQGWKTMNAKHLTTRSFKSILERPPSLLRRCSDLRHTWATLLLVKRMHPKNVPQLLSHATIYIALDIYSHALPNTQGEAVTTMRGALV
jgi:integrase